ncbi:hypothetical protein M0R45_001542 [Rubus argutus]|uniref:Uncharacterized protein n=1 Tax=Rubus argutus TaxID=59490 RepID=A0AAW1VJY9_RUBAR
MDTLFRLVTLQQQQQQQQSDQSFNSSTRTTTTTSSSSRSFTHHPQNHHHYPQQNDVEECFNFFMDEEDFSSSSSKAHYYPTPSTPTPPPQLITTTTTPTPTDFSFSPAHDLVNFEISSPKWAPDLLLETARAIADKNSARVQQLMWMLNELGSPYGDTDQKLASYFLQALFSRMTDSGDRCYRTLVSASEKTCSFESTRKMVLKFQEVSPWTTFGHVACNGAIMEAFDGEAKLHIVDISNTYCTQWPTLLEALATRTDETPHLRLTSIVVSRAGDGSAGVGSTQKVMKEIGARMEKFARLMGVPFKFNAIQHSGDLADLNLADLDKRR